MSDNLKAIEVRVNQDIDPNGAPGSILALNHNEILKEVLSKSGKYVGSPYVAYKVLTTIPTGLFSWESNAMNNTSNFDIKIAKLTSDFNDITTVLNTLTIGSIIQFKDFVGRSVYLQYQSHVAGVDDSANDIFIITVKGYASNPNYVYQDAESEICVLSIFGGGSGSLSTKESFIATPAQTDFVLTNEPNNVDVHVDRIYQIEGTDYTLATDTVTMIDPQDVGSVVEIRKY